MTAVLHKNEIELILAARAFSTVEHAQQTRKYSGEPYAYHTYRVAEMISDDDEAISLFGENYAPMVCAAYLHDTVEDCGVPLSKIGAMFGFVTERIVCDLTEFSVKTDGNRALRKALDARHLARASAEAQYVKLADLIDNTRDIVANDKNFAKTYIAEKDYLLTHALTRVSSTNLYAEAVSLISSSKTVLNAVQQQGEPMKLPDDKKIKSIRKDVDAWVNVIVRAYANDRVHISVDSSRFDMLCSHLHDAQFDGRTLREYLVSTVEAGIVKAILAVGIYEEIELVVSYDLGNKTIVVTRSY